MLKTLEDEFVAVVPMVRLDDDDDEVATTILLVVAAFCVPFLM